VNFNTEQISFFPSDHVFLLVSPETAQSVTIRTKRFTEREFMKKRLWIFILKIKFPEFHSVALGHRAMLNNLLF
jgi:hypothetical protein